MLNLLRVRSFAIIDELEVELGPGLNVVTGETGAGKSILVDALELVLGARGRPEVVRTGAEEAEVEALFDVSDAPEVRARLEAAGLAPDQELLVRRVIQANGRTRAYVNGKLATAGQLAEIAAGLADISSQHEHHTLVDPATHLSYLDAFGSLDALRAQVGEAHDALARAAAALAELRAAVSGRAEREDLLRFQIREIDELDPKAGEAESLGAERNRLRHAEKLATVAGGAEEAIYARDGAMSEELGKIAHDVAEAARLDSRLEPIGRELEDVRSRLEDVARDLGRYARTITVDPDRLAELDERVEKLRRLERKYGGSIAGILEHRARAGAELETLSKHEQHEAALVEAHDAALAAATSAARSLSKKRRTAAEKLGTAIGKELASLGMGDARVEVDVAPLDGRTGELIVDGARLSATGIDRAEFLIAPNRGEEARPLRRVASGGELSRAMLAIKRVLAGLGPAGLYVFDEVDAGVGGAVAETIGRKLRDVAGHHQVICITHLPQIAVFAGAHFRVKKDVESGRTRSTIDRLDEKERKEEIARMLGGAKITAKTRAAAAEMLDEARGD